MNFQNGSENPQRFQEVPKDDRTMAMVMWILSLFTSFIGPLIIWLMKKDESPFINQQGKNYLNYAISYAIYGVVSYILTLIIIGIIPLIAISIASIVYTIMAIIAVNKGEDYVVPFSLPIIK
ncbi:DUF4870 domain-containing protein [Staphylococcus carnosus]|uniref:DUF4870 domain-containing protein n=1 Tax=Staphylococcus carnosus (strain TM300) TaxID=396513 RepID=B9DJ38_STACT|nr:DUF4870 domain-containing protein [Staphylococcus carnosus]ANZ34511.1 hypothetical protein BEK99_12465 [Staphylococcus carnosus]KOR12559.1 hypothetical protein AMC75_08755 [Staphylococcus carnosus]QPT02978.1 DUF4870 domain-containing protein [Staphylococcus carnosus]UQA67982.1 DUF4870 domain-containing protein [Staphylococcus carnosus]UTB77201.1 hypothetical protein A2I62_00795 [Staphylococcus carnosus]